MQTILILFAHPALQKSRVHRVLRDHVLEIEGVSFHDLYEVYPEFDIDIDREQQMLEKHDIVIFQHPLFWYSIPAILKEWQDLVLEHGWAYGAAGNALRGKKLMNVISAGGSEAAYSADGYNRHTIRQLLAPIEQTAYLCGMEYLPPFVIHGTHRMPSGEILRQAQQYRLLLAAIRDERVDWGKARACVRINADLESITIAEKGGPVAG